MATQNGSDVQLVIMTPAHPDWETFAERLQGPEGCDFKKDERGKTTWRCGGGWNKQLAEAILRKHYPDVDVDGSLEFFEAHGGHCDCEILFNVDPAI